MVLEETLESPLDCKEIKPVIPKGNQSLIFIGRTDAEGEAPVLWPPDVKSQLIGKDQGKTAGKGDRRQERGRQRMRCLDGIIDAVDMNFKTLGDGDGQRSLECCSPWGHKESEMTK